jgi:hypothetical protein
MALTGLFPAHQSEKAPGTREQRMEERAHQPAVDEAYERRMRSILRNKAIETAVARGQNPNVPLIEAKILAREREDREVAIGRGGTALGVGVGLLASVFTGPVGGLTAASLTAAGTKTYLRFNDRTKRHAKEDKELFG